MIENYTFYIQPFKHTIDGKKYTIEAEIIWLQQLSFDKNTADARDDLHEEFSIEEILVLDEQGNDCSESVFIETNILRDQLLAQIEMGAEDDLSQLSIRHISDEVGWYYQ